MWQYRAIIAYNHAVKNFNKISQYCHIWPPVIFRIKADDDETTTHIAH